jgi:hypothetical protein
VVVEGAWCCWVCFRNCSFAYHSVQEAPAFYPDRVVTIRGSVDNMSAAEAIISTKLRECHERDLQNPAVSDDFLPVIELVMQIQC